MAVTDASGPETVDEYVTVCDACGEPVSSFALDAEGKAACVPCGHLPHVSLVRNPVFEPDAAA